MICIIAHLHIVLQRGSPPIRRRVHMVADQWAAYYLQVNKARHRNIISQPACRQG